MSVAAFGDETVFQGAWHFLAAVVDRTQKTPMLLAYADGVEIQSVPILDVGSLETPLSASIGCALDDLDAPTHFFSGLVDEVRVSAAARSPEWLATEHASLDEPSSLVTVGPED